MNAICLCSLRTRDSRHSPKVELRLILLLSAVACISGMTACGGDGPPHGTPTTPSQPAGYTLSGSVTEPGAGPIAGVAITTRPNPSGGPARTGTATTDSAGHYEMRDVAGCLWVRTSRDGYEGGEWDNCVSLDDGDAIFETTMQRILRIEVGSALDERVLANDMAWLLDILTDDGCGPCKIVRIVAPRAGKVLVRVTWIGAADAIGLWMQTGQFVAPGFPIWKDYLGPNVASGTIDVTSGQEFVVYVAWETAQPAGDQPFHLESRFLAPGE